MRHLKKKGRKFGRVKKVRKALLKSLAVALVSEGKIRTTQARAKELAKTIAPLVTKAKKGGLANARAIARILPPELVSKMAKEIGPRYQSRAGGYTRIVRLGQVRKDGARMCVVEWV